MTIKTTKKINLTILWLLLFFVMFAIVAQIMQMNYGNKAAQDFNGLIGYDKVKANVIVWLLGVVSIALCVCLWLYSSKRGYKKSKLYYALFYVAGGVGLVLMVLLAVSAHKDHTAFVNFKNSVMYNSGGIYNPSAFALQYQVLGSDFESLSVVYVPSLIICILSFVIYFGSILNEALERKGIYDKFAKEHPVDEDVKDFDASVDVLEKSKLLLDQGIITKREFTKIKKEELSKHSASSKKK